MCWSIWQEQTQDAMTGPVGEKGAVSMKQMGQEARLNYIVEELKKDSVSFRDMEVRPRDRRRVMRSLMNIRMPGPLPAGFLEIQDEFLREEAREKGIVSLG